MYNYEQARAPSIAHGTSSELLRFPFVYINFGEFKHDYFSKNFAQAYWLYLSPAIFNVKRIGIIEFNQ